MTFPASAPVVVTATGTLDWVELPLPSWPLAPEPQLKTRPSRLRICTWSKPAEICLRTLPLSAPVISTATGTLESVVLLLPNWPLEFRPQA